MKKFLLPIMAISIFFCFYEYSKPVPNIYIVLITIAIFMFGMMKLMSKVPSKKPEDKDGIL
ncbi:hypothetical protein [Flavobacterium sp.]|uniref:hypothetical protein n=1 Tax=Flavobacterium sp. TaxID=239 RepID=UPI003750A8C3